ncbi:MAG: pseudouridine synthase [Methylomonas sp.]|nr:pseudouridine synthase [Methylomonas sp.]PPD22539.1 MAG: pseudouridine synthase [Methylomonas sp.]PPD27851.1 MAG: pseudouridine synthase [Methylomonas sp.]PPD39960.1 MAG: pseudouridine synthase [Methylomonas sp.]PPD41060.1 MAG: pseudouridine synthase [Methylomonas sp.]
MPTVPKAAPATDSGGERIQKLLARAGLGSRREIERWIEEGRLTVNGNRIQPGYHLKPGDHLQINGRIVKWEKYAEQPTRVLVYHKPAGELVTRRDPEGRPVIFTQLPRLAVGRWIAVGRLDINTSGLLMVTNNGELANRLMHPSRQVEREYAVRVLGEVDDAMIERLQAGVELDDGPAHFDDVHSHTGENVDNESVNNERANKWFYVTVKQGRNRLVRRLWESQGIKVSRLIRVRYGDIRLPERVRAHSFYELETKDLQALMATVGL